MNKLKYKSDTDKEGQQFTSFCLKEGSTFKLGDETVELADDVEVIVRHAVPRDAVVDMITASGNVSQNAESFPYSETRDGVKYDITYGGRGQRIETNADAKALAEADEKAEPKKTKAESKAESATKSDDAKSGVKKSGSKPVKIEDDPEPSKSLGKPGQVQHGDTAPPE